MSAWLITIPRNLSRSEYRKRRREVEDADGRHIDSLKSPLQQQSGWNSRNFVWRSRSCRPASGGSASRRRAGLLPRRGGYDLRERGRDDKEPGQSSPHATLEAALRRQRRQVRPRPHDACRSDRRRARSAARLGGCHFPRRCVGHTRRAGRLNFTGSYFPILQGLLHRPKSSNITRSRLMGPPRRWRASSVDCSASEPSPPRRAVP
jgi:hypothetical protein